MKQKILFVDDEPNLLDSMRRMLHGMRQEWDMAFALGGAEALDLLAQAPFDVVVSDMRMPGMDGAQFLTKVQERFPATIRIILSGHSETGTVLKAVKPAHQFLSKPCTPNEIKRVIKRALTLRHILNNEAVKRVITSIDSLPVVPALFMQLVEELQKDEPPVITVGNLISQDVGMSAGILKVVNSSFFGLRTHISGLHHAITLLGIETIKALVLSVHLFTRYTADPSLGFSFEGLWRHSVQVGGLSRSIAQLETSDTRIVDICSMAGLLHDVGKLVLACHFAEDYKKILASVRRENRPLYEMEQAHLGVTHAEVGAYLLGLWGLDEDVVEAIFHHHAPELHTSQAVMTLAAVHAANTLEHELTVINPDRAPHPMNVIYIREQGLFDRLPLWREASAKNVSEEAHHGE